MTLPTQYQRRPDPIATAKPWVTTALLLLCLFAYFQCASHGLLWLKSSSFVPGKYVLFQMQHRFVPLLQMMFWATFAQANFWQLLGSCYFLWVFGSLVELRLGLLRYLFLVALSIYGGWAMLAWEAGVHTYGLYVGPGLLTASVIGAYMIFFPEKKINAAGSIGRSTRFFKNEPDPDPREAFGVSPWAIIGAFVVYELVMYFFLGTMHPQFEPMRWLSGLAAFVLGLLTSGALVASAAGGMTGNPLQILAIQRYQQLRSLDISHDEAIEGTARLMSVPVEQVKAWVSKGGGPLPGGPLPQAPQSR